MPQVDPKFTFWFGVWTNVLMLVAGYGVEHAPPLVAQYAPTVQWFASLAAQTNSVILTALVGISSTKAGPLINVPAIASTVVKILLVAFVLSAFLATGSAQAQVDTRQHARPATAAADAQPQQSPCLFPIDPLNLCGKLPGSGNSEDNMKAVVARLKATASADLNYALAKANQAATNTSKVRAQCIQGIINAKNQFDGDVKDQDGKVIPRPDPAFVTLLEDVAELADNLSPQGPLLTSCAGAAQMFKMTALQVVNSFVTGAAGIAMLPAGL